MLRLRLKVGPIGISSLTCLVSVSFMQLSDLQAMKALKEKAAGKVSKQCCFVPHLQIRMLEPLWLASARRAGQRVWNSQLSSFLFCFMSSHNHILVFFRAP